MVVSEKVSGFDKFGLPDDPRPCSTLGFPLKLPHQYAPTVTNDSVSVCQYAQHAVTVTNASVTAWSLCQIKQEMYLMTQCKNEGRI